MRRWGVWCEDDSHGCTALQNCPVGAGGDLHPTSAGVAVAAHAGGWAGRWFWQSVTGSKDGETKAWAQVAAREVWEETGIDAHGPGCLLQDWELENVYPIYPQWLHRYAPGVCMNTERVFGLQVPSYVQLTLNPREHSAFAWHAWREAADRCYAPSNAEAILHLPAFLSA